MDDQSLNPPSARNGLRVVPLCGGIMPQVGVGRVGVVRRAVVVTVWARRQLGFNTENTEAEFTEFAEDEAERPPTPIAHARVRTPMKGIGLRHFLRIHRSSE